MRSFASDNNASVHPAVLQSVMDANRDHAVGYGADPWTLQAEAAILHAFGCKTAEAFLVFNGTGANCVALQVVTRPWNSVLCAYTAHIYVDECGAPSRMTGCQLVPIDTPDGKLTPQMLEPHLHTLGIEHHSQPGAVYISQTTELGTVYSPAEIRALADFAHTHGLLLHMDGARLANACAATGCSLRQMTIEAGVDILSFGGTKNGMMLGEAVVSFRPELSRSLRFIRKQSAQLASKMRFLAAQWLPYLGPNSANDGASSSSEIKRDDTTTPLWLSNALHANQMAARMADILACVPGVRFTQKVESNQIFCILPAAILARLREHYFFYMWNEAVGEARFVTSWDTTENDLTQFAQILSL